MKIENHDLEKIDLILHDALLVADVPLLFFAAKQETSPQFEIKITLPLPFPTNKERLFLPLVNDFIKGVYDTASPAFSADLQAGVKNLAKVYDVETAASPAKVRTIGLCPIVVEKDVQGFLFFAAREIDPRRLKLIDCFAQQIAAFYWPKNTSIALLKRRKRSKT